MSVQKLSCTWAIKPLPDLRISLPDVLTEELLHNLQAMIRQIPVQWLDGTIAFSLEVRPL